MFGQIRRLTGLVALFGCVLAAHDLGAQAVSSNVPSQTGTSGQSTPASGAKAHDDSFVIGNDDVLAINVWKEPDISRVDPSAVRWQNFAAARRRSASCRDDTIEIGAGNRGKTEELHLGPGSDGNRPADQQSEVQRSRTWWRNLVRTR